MPLPVWIVLLPLLGAVIAGIGVRFVKPRTAEVLTTGLLLTAAILSWIVAFDVIGNNHTYHLKLWPWFESGRFVAWWSVLVDPLTAVMLIVVNTVSALVHLYSIGYMHEDAHRQRFFAYLSLFTFFMLMLVTADNFVQLFLGWEGVGLSSYLLIGFWYKKQSANAAAMKAFIVNRVGDVGLALGIFAIFLLFGSVQYETVFANAGQYIGSRLEFLGQSYHALTLICLLLFVGAMGKSAQVPLHTWLPDAMEGPTPVSALIHAATMVTAGVFLVARCSPLFEFAPDALTVVTFVGAFTALFAATIGLVQNDIKRVIAYSTCSQLGYMFFACGVGAYSVAIFHLMTHAFFKALLFLGAGSVIHAMHHEQDMRFMGGIWRKIPITYALMWIGSLALAGIPIFAGYYSKDMILESAFAADTPMAGFAFWMGITAAFLTAFYSWRLIIMTFHGAPRAEAEVMAHVHESPPVMLIPLYVLAAGAIAAGFVGYHLLGMVDADGEFWNGAIFMLGQPNILDAAHHVPGWVAMLPVLVGALGIAAAWYAYARRPQLPQQAVDRSPALYRFLYNKWYFDELYDALFVRPAKALGQWFWQAVDIGVIDRFGPNGLAALSVRLGRRTSSLQTGYLYHYALAMLLGVLVVMTWLTIETFGLWG